MTGRRVAPRKVKAPKAARASKKTFVVSDAILHARRDSISYLSYEILKEVTNHLDGPDMICLALTSKHFASTVQNIGIDVPQMDTKGYKDHLCTLIQLRPWFPRRLSLCWMCGKYKEKAYGRRTWGFARTKDGMPRIKSQRNECLDCATSRLYFVAGGVDRGIIQELTWKPQRKRPWYL